MRFKRVMAVKIVFCFKLLIMPPLPSWNINFVFYPSFQLFGIPFIRIGVLSVIVEWAGGSVLDSYMVNIFKNSGISISPEAAPILVSSIQLVLSLVSTLILHKSPRKPLFLGCGFFIFLGTFMLGAQALLTEKLTDEDHTTSYGWIPVLGKG